MTLPDPDSIRLASPADLPALAALEDAAFFDPWSPAQIAAELAEPHALVLIAAGDSGETRGYAVFRHIAGEAELLRLAVIPTARRRGVARRLAVDGIERLRQSGCSGCYLEVRTTNRPAIELYEALDFRRAGTRRRYYVDGTDALIMKLDL
jgi:ribosomal-protein-alanine acetyltransferase